MKQDISWEDFMSLDYNQVIKLQQLINQKYHTIDNEKQWEEIKNYKHVFEDGTESNIHTSYLGFLEKCNIGKMIEILCNSDFYFPSIELTESKYRSEYIVVGVTCLSGSKEFRGKTFEGDNLCDALWEAVKLVL
jgi:hypothetical protein